MENFELHERSCRETNENCIQCCKGLMLRNYLNTHQFWLLRRNVAKRKLSTRKKTGTEFNAIKHLLGEQGRMDTGMNPCIFNEWSKGFAQNPSRFSPVTFGKQSSVYKQGKEFRAVKHVLEEPRGINTGVDQRISDEYSEKFTQNSVRSSRIISGEHSLVGNQFGIVSYDKSDLLKQNFVHKEEKTYTCNYCWKEFSRKCYLVKHSKVHTRGQSFVCTQCGERFTQKDSLSDHQLIHIGEHPFVCNECGKGFSSKCSLTKHNSMHTGKISFVCSECGESFTRRDSLRDHKRTHTGERPYVCKDCGKRFARRYCLAMHRRVHTKQRPYVCDECGKDFTGKHKLIEHIRIHRGEKPFACTECEKRFTQRIHLVRHHLVHTGEKPFSCTKCGKRFSRKDRLKRHVLETARCHQNKQG